MLAPQRLRLAHRVQSLPGRSEPLGVPARCAAMAFTPQAKAEKALKELQKLPANKRCADCSGNGSLVRLAFPRPGLLAGCPRRGG